MFSHRQLGQALVEFALVAVLLLTLVLGLVEFGHLAFVYAATVNAAKEAARYGAAVGPASDGVTPRFADCEGIRSRALALGSLIGMTEEDITIAYDHGPDTTPFATCPPSKVDLGDRIVVTVQSTYQPWVPLFPNVSLTFTSTSARSILSRVSVPGAPPTNVPTTPAPTATPTATPEVSPTPPPGPTATFTPTLTPSITPTPTPTNTPTPTPFPTATPYLPPPILNLSTSKQGANCVLDKATLSPNPAWPSFDSVIYYVKLEDPNPSTFTCPGSNTNPSCSIIYGIEIPKNTSFTISAHAILQEEALFMSTQSTSLSCTCNPGGKTVCSTP